MSAATTRCRSKSCVPSSPFMLCRTGGRAASAASRFFDTAAWGTPCRSTHADDGVILEFGLKKPAYRIVVNTPTTHGSIGLTTGLDPAMTLGCGGYGGNITSDNISPRHLLNIKRLAYEVTPAIVATGLRPRRADSRPQAAAAACDSPAACRDLGRRAGAKDRRVSDVARLSGRGTAGRTGHRPPPHRPRRPDRRPEPAAPSPTVEKPTDFVCEEDVRQAIRQGRKIVIGERSIVTPAARDLGEQHRLFVQASWR